MATEFRFSVSHFLPIKQHAFRISTRNLLELCALIFACTPSKRLPLGAAIGSRPNQHWFALTDGWFWIEVGDQELFRYSQQILEYWKQIYPESRSSPLPQGLRGLSSRPLLA